MTVFGLIFMLIPSFMLFIFMRKGTTTLKTPQPTISTETTQTNKVESEEEKYKKINDSIIK